ncbi:MAG: hypothetical protein WC694_02315 [Candidatus Paceibacterota bacterium]|jgi:hypothetical protein
MIKINLFKKEKSFKKKDFIFHTHFYWRIVLFCAVVIIFLSFLFSYRIFMQINQDHILSNTNDSGQSPMINKERIKKVLNYFSEREKKSAEILNSSAPVADPSF